MLRTLGKLNEVEHPLGAFFGGLLLDVEDLAANTFTHKEVLESGHLRLVKPADE